MSPSRKAFGRILRRHRLAKGLTQRQVSHALQWSSAQYISNIERGVAYPPLDTLPILSKMLGMKLRALGKEYWDARHGELDEEEREWAKKQK